MLSGFGTLQLPYFEKNTSRSMHACWSIVRENRCRISLILCRGAFTRQQILPPTVALQQQTAALAKKSLPIWPPDNAEQPTMQQQVWFPVVLQQQQQLLHLKVPLLPLQQQQLHVTHALHLSGNRWLYQ